MIPPLHAGTRAAALERLRGRLERAGIATAASEAEALLLHGLGLSRAAFWCEPDAALAPEEARALDDLAARRERRVPLQYLVGEVDFHEVTLDVEPGVFIPRPETETLVEAVLEELHGAAASPAQAGEPAPGRLLDLGTGTGAVAVALLQGLPGWSGVAMDRNPAAVALAAHNAARNGCADRLRVVPGDFTKPVADASRAWGTGPFDLLVSNPPYVPRDALAGLMPEVRDYDPREALDGGPDGLDAYRAIARIAPRLLRNGGVLGLEIGEDQADAILGLFGPSMVSPRVRHDLAGRPRVVIGTWRGGAA